MNCESHSWAVWITRLEPTNPWLGRDRTTRQPFSIDFVSVFCWQTKAAFHVTCSTGWGTCSADIFIFAFFVSAYTINSYSIRLCSWPKIHQNNRKYNIKSCWNIKCWLYVATLCRGDCKYRSGKKNNKNKTKNIQANGNSGRGQQTMEH